MMAIALINLYGAIRRQSIPTSLFLLDLLLERVEVKTRWNSHMKDTAQREHSNPLWVTQAYCSGYTIFFD